MESKYGIISNFPPPADLVPYVKKIYLVQSPHTGYHQFIPAWTSSLLVLQYDNPVYSDINGSPEIVHNISFTGMATKQYKFDTPAKEKLRW